MTLKNQPSASFSGRSPSPNQRQFAEDLGVPNGPGFIALLEAFRATGGTAPGAVVGRLIEEHQVRKAVSLAELIYTGQVFGFEWRTSLWIPMFQFDGDDLSVKPAAQRVRAALPALWSGWTLASWFAASNERLDGRSAADMLDLDVTAVIRAARRLGTVDDAPPRIVQRAREVAARA